MVERVSEKKTVAVIKSKAFGEEENGEFAPEIMALHEVEKKKNEMHKKAKYEKSAAS